MRFASAVFVVSVIVGCPARDPAPAVASSALPTHREQARAVLEQHCADCHVPDPVTGTALALHVFDLTKPDWSATLSDEQLPIVEQKLFEDAATERERAILRDFVNDELDWREAQRRGPWR